MARGGDQARSSFAFIVGCPLLGINILAHTLVLLPRRDNSIGIGRHHHGGNTGDNNIHNAIIYFEVTAAKPLKRRFHYKMRRAQSTINHESWLYLKFRVPFFLFSQNKGGDASAHHEGMVDFAPSYFSADPG